MAFIMTLWTGNGTVLKIPVNGNKKFLKILKIVPAMNYLFLKFFYLPLTGTLKNCTITYP